jgi:hypothetical protein
MIVTPFAWAAPKGRIFEQTDQVTFLDTS